LNFRLPQRSRPTEAGSRQVVTGISKVLETFGQEKHIRYLVDGVVDGKGFIHHFPPDVLGVGVVLIADAFLFQYTVKSFFQR